MRLLESLRSALPSSDAERVLLALESIMRSQIRLVELRELELGLDPPTLAAAAAAAGPQPADTVRVSTTDHAFIQEMQLLAATMAGILGRTPTEDEVILEYDRLHGAAE